MVRFAKCLENAPQNLNNTCDHPGLHSMQYLINCVILQPLTAQYDGRLDIAALNNLSLCKTYLKRKMLFLERCCRPDFLSRACLSPNFAITGCDGILKSD